MRLGLLLAFLLLSALLRADYSGTTIRWTGWYVTTSEDAVYGRLDRRYTIMNLLDDDPRTTWVFNHTSKTHWLRKEMWNDHDCFDFEGPAAGIDGFRIMNGYNKSERLYKLNDRVASLTIYADDKKIKSVRLTDRMGWHTVSLPKTQAERIRFEITGISQGKVHDLCLSGLQLLRRGKAVPWHVDKTVFYNAGGESEPNDMDLWTNTGKYIVTDRGNNIMGPMVSPSGRFIIGTDCPGKFISLWIVDRDKGKVIMRKRMFREPHPEYPHVYHESGKWAAERVVDVRFEVQSKKPMPDYVVRRVKF